MTIAWLKPPHRALLVGINEYDAPKTLISTLHGCVADALAMRDFLTQELGMAAENILLLTSPAADDDHTATRANIWRGLRDFLGDAPADSELLFYYSGHGSEAQIAADIAFGDKKGEALVPKDARTGQVLDILDREMWAIRDHWHQKKLRLTVIADSCFAGGSFRGDPNNPERMPMARLTGAANTLRTVTTLATVGGEAQTLESLSRLHDANTVGYPFQTLIAGCRSNQLSWELLSPQGQKRGVMTTALLTALRSAGGSMTYAELAQLLPAFVTPSHLEKQEPNITGDDERGIFGTVIAAREKPVFAIQTINADGTLELRSGLIAGLELNSVVASYNDWSFDKPTGEWKVIGAKAKWAKLERLNGTEIPQVGQPVQLMTRSNTPTVYFDPSAQKIKEAWYQADKVDSPALIEVKEAVNAGYVVTRDQNDFVARRNDGLIRPELRKAQRDPRAIFDLARQLNRVAAYETFVNGQPSAEEEWSDLTLNAPDGIELTVEAVDWNGNATPLSSDGVATLPKGARVRLTATNHTPVELWIAIYLLDEPFFVAERLYPNDSDFHLLSEQSRSVTWNNNEWRGGLLSLKLFVSSQSINATDAQRYPCGRRDTQRGAEISRGLRPVAYEAGEGEGWATYQITYGR